MLEEKIGDDLKLSNLAYPCNINFGIKKVHRTNQGTDVLRGSLNRSTELLLKTSI